MTRAQPRYVHLRVRRPATVWPVVRPLAVGAVLALAATLVLRPQLGLLLLWQVVVPVLPLVFLLAPSWWRQACPLAAMTRAPRAVGLRGRTLPRGLREHAGAIALAVFLGVVTARLSPLGSSGPAAAALLVGALGAALAGGIVFKGKSGWCGTFCPLGPVQELYGQASLGARPTPCPTCVGCVAHCTDIEPRTAYRERLAAGGRPSAYRALLAGLLPGFTVAFHLLPAPASPADLGVLVLAALASLGAFLAVEALVGRRTARLPAVSAALALIAFYWFNVPAVVDGVERLLGLEVPGRAAWEARFVVIALVVGCFARLWRRAPTPAPAVPAPAVAVAVAPQVTVLPQGRTVPVSAGSTLLEAAEAQGLAGWEGCRNGVCGCDPVVVSEGAGHLSPAPAGERATLQRLGAPAGARLACRARVYGDVTIAALPGAPAAAAVADALAGEPVPEAPFRVQVAPVRPAAPGRIVVVGAGAAGASAVQTLRRLDADCEIHLVGDEAQPPYDRTGLPRAVHAGTPVDALRLHPPAWAQELRIATALASPAVGLDAERRVLTLAGGEELGYDRLILATGALPPAPVVAGPLPAGCFGLRTADDVARIRAYAEAGHVRRALVAGGGVRGLEAADALHRLGLAVTVVHGGPWLAHRHLDARAGELVAEHLRFLGIEVILEARVRALAGEDVLARATLSDGRARAIELLVACTGLTPEASLARTGGLVVQRGVVVDDRMATSAPGVFAAGDVAEHRDRVHGLWSEAVAQAEVAAAAALDQDARYAPGVDAVTLRVGELEISAIGRSTPTPGDREIVAPRDRGGHRRALLDGGRIVGAVLVGQPAALVDGLREAVAEERDVRAHEAELRAGDWSALAAGLAAAA